MTDKPKPIKDAEGARQLITWIARNYDPVSGELGLSKRNAAKILGINESRLYRLMRGEVKVPDYLGMAAAAHEAGLSAWQETKIIDQTAPPPAKPIRTKQGREKRRRRR